MARRAPPGEVAPTSTRPPQVVIVAGRNFAGKTTLARKLVSAHRRVVVIAPSGEWGIWGDPEVIATQAVREKADALVLDDCDAYLPQNGSEFWTRLFSTNRHLGLDVLLLTRRPQALPLWAVSAASTAYLLQLGPRENEWCRKKLRATPPATGYTPTVVTL